MFLEDNFGSITEFAYLRQTIGANMRTEGYKLTHIEIGGFKSISATLPLKLDFADVNILLGANGAGKSNIVSFFKMLGYMMSGSMQMYVAQAGTNQTFLHYGAKVTPCITASLRYESEEEYDVYNFSLTHAVPNRLIIKSEDVEWGSLDDDSKPHRSVVTSDYNESGLINSSHEVCAEIRSLLSMCKVYQFSDSSMTAPMRQASAVDSAHYLQSEANNLASFLYFLRENYKEAYQRIVSYVRTVIPQFGDFYLEPERGYISLKWTDNTANDYVFNAEQFSDGSIRFIALATLLLQPQETMPHVIIIDEPELGLHPYAIDQLAEMIKDASLHAQIVLATQSPALIDGFDIGCISVIEQDEEKHCTVARNLDSATYGEWLEEYTNSELWNKNVLGGRPV